MNNYPAALLLSVIFFLPSARSVADDALVQFNLNHLDQAKALYLAQLDKPATQADALNHLTRINAIQGNLDLGLGYAEKAVALTPNSAEAYWVLGQIYGAKAVKASIFSMLGLAKKCLAAFNKAYELDNKNIDVLDALITYHRLAPGIAGGSNSKRDNYVAELRAINPELGQIRQLEIRVQEGKDVLPQAKALYQQGLTQPQAVYSLAHYFKDQQLYSEAITLFKQLITMALNPETTRDNRWAISDAYLQLGEIYLAQKQQLDKGIELVKTHLQLNPDPKDVNYFWSHLSLAKLYLADNQPVEYQKLIKQIQAMDYQQDKPFAKAFEREVNNR